MIISVSLGNFYYWNEKFDNDTQLDYLTMVKNFDIDGIELHFTQDMIRSRGYLKYVGRLDGFVITAHLPDKFDINELEPHIKEMQEVLGVKHFVIHADTFASLKRVPDIPIVVENTDIRRADYQELKDVAAFKKDICLDINHVIEAFPDKVHEQIACAKDAIKEIHFSAVTSPLQEEYKDYDDCPHWPANGSGMDIPEELPKDAIWVMEGIIPKDRLDVLEDEIKLLRDFASA